MTRELNEHQIRVAVLAREVWDSDSDATLFLTTPHSELDGMAPLDVAAEEGGANRVEIVLRKLYWGLTP